MQIIEQYLRSVIQYIFFFLRKNNLYFSSFLPVVMTSRGIHFTWSHSTPAAVSTTSITWILWATTPPPSLGGTSCWRQTASTISTCRKKTRRSSKLCRDAQRDLSYCLKHMYSSRCPLTHPEPLQVDSKSDCMWTCIRVLCLTAKGALFHASVNSW